MIASSLSSFVNAVRGPLMMEHMAEFARWTKHSGTQEELKSLDYVRARMVDYGFQTDLVLHDAYISLPGAARVELDGRAHRAITHSFSRAAPAGGLTAPVVDLGTGAPEDFAATDVRGRIVLIDGIANPAASRRASLAGAAGQLHVSPHEHLHEMCISPVWGSPTHETASGLPSTVVLTVSKQTGQAVRAALAAGATLPVTLHAEVDTGWRATPILVAQLPGPNPTADEPFILFTGHHDTWYYGVMDNGGANATMMEVARLCSLNRAEWKRGLRVVFWSGHSQGRYSGSAWYADEHWEELERRALVHVNVDSTGGMGNTVVADTTAAAELRALAREAIAEQGGQQFSNRRMGRAGDQSFWGIGVPSIFGNMSEQPAGGEANASAAVFGGGRRMGHGTGWWWHTPDDLLDKIDEAILVRDTRIYAHVVWRLLTDPILPLDYAEHARYLKEELVSLQAAAEARFDLSELLRRAERLEELGTRLNERRERAESPDEVERINGALVAVSRALVPVDYTEGDRFGQDPALAQQAYPGLQPIRRFASLDPKSDEAKFLNVGMMRARNRVAYALARASAVLENCLAAPEQRHPVPA